MTGIMTMNSSNQTAADKLLDMFRETMTIKEFEHFRTTPEYERLRKISIGTKFSHIQNTTRKLRYEIHSRARALAFKELWARAKELYSEPSRKYLDISERADIVAEKMMVEAGFVPPTYTHKCMCRHCGEVPCTESLVGKILNKCSWCELLFKRK